MPARGPEGGLRTLLLVVAVLLPAAAISGCISQPGTQLTARPGDLVRAQIKVVEHLPRSDDGSTDEPACLALERGPRFCDIQPRPYALAQRPPATLPAGWEAVQALPEPLIDVVSGMAEGDQRRMDGYLAFGDRSEDLVEHHPLRDALPRVVQEPGAYGRNWTTQARDDGMHLITPVAEDEGASLEVPRWCNDRFCLFTSELVGWNETHLNVRHQPEPGAQVFVEALATWLAVTEVGNGTFTLDNNHPLAGQGFGVIVDLEEVRTPPPGQRRAPSFTLTTLEGERVSLSDYAGKPLVLEFFASWCPSCRKNTEHLSKLQQTYGTQVNILAIGVDAWEDRASLEAFIEQNGVTWPIAMDTTGRVSRDYGVGSLSTEVLVSPTGAIVHVETGVADHERVSRILHDILPPDHHDDPEVTPHP